MNIKTLLTNLFGTYQPLTDTNGDIILGISGIDFQYILGVILFIVFMYCLLKIFGGFLNGK